MSPRTILFLIVVSVFAVSCGSAKGGTEQASSSSDISSESIASVASEGSMDSSSSMHGIPRGSKISSPNSSSSKPVISQTDLMVQDFSVHGTLHAENSNAYGTVKTQYSNEVFSLLATVINLPDPSSGKQYIGWLVRENPPAFIRTGELKTVYGSRVNTFTESHAFSDYTLYVVTDDDPSAASPGPRVMWSRLEPQKPSS